MRGPAVACAMAVMALMAAGPAPAGAAPGGLDPTFGDAGLAIVEMQSAPVPFYDTAHDLALDAGGGIAVAGDVGSLATHIGLARLTADGAPVAQFGTGGKVLGPQGTARAVAFDPDGGILVAGAAAPTFSGAVLRFNPDGSRDDGGATDADAASTFGTAGLAASGTPSPAQRLAVQPADGRIVVAGSSGGNLVVRRLTPAGVIDPSFGAGGTTSIAFPDVTQVDVVRVLVDPVGRTVLAVTCFAAGGGSSSSAIVRLTTGGLPDLSFGAGGVVGPSRALVVTDLLAQDSALVALGRHNGWATGWRLDASGARDLAFGTDGALPALGYDVPTGPGLVTVRVDGTTGTWLPDGRLIAAGSAWVPDSTTVVRSEVGTARFLADGTPDTTYARCGIAHAEARASTETGSTALRVAAQADGRVVVLAGQPLGLHTPALPVRFVVARLQGGAGPPTPEVVPTTLPATDVEATSATLRGSIDPQGDSSVFFHWDLGTDTGYGTVIGSGSEVDGAGVTPVALTVAELTPGTTYHHRLVAWSDCGREIRGADRTFTTPAATPGTAGTPGTPPAASGTAAGAPVPALGLTLGLVPGQTVRSVRTRGLVVRATCTRACAVAARLLLDRRTARRLRLATSPAVRIAGGKATLAANVARRLTLRLTPAARRRLAGLRNVGLRLEADASSGGERTGARAALRVTGRGGIRATAAR